MAAVVGIVADTPVDSNRQLVVAPVNKLLQLVAAVHNQPVPEHCCKPFVVVAAAAVVVVVVVGQELIVFACFVVLVATVAVVVVALPVVIELVVGLLLQNETRI